MCPGKKDTHPGVIYGICCGKNDTLAARISCRGLDVHRGCQKEEGRPGAYFECLGVSATKVNCKFLKIYR